MNCTLRAMKETDPDRLLHYEGWCGGGGDAGAGSQLDEAERLFVQSTFDFQSRMYPQFDTMKKAFDAPWLKGLPYIMCEYSHAMGNSCGDLRFYNEIMDGDPRYAGGFVWEWCDHGLRRTDENGCEYFAYGGDFGEKHHFANICVDGLVAPNRQPHSSLLEMKAVYAPLRITLRADGMLEFANRYAFRDLEELDFVWSIEADGCEQACGSLQVCCPAGETSAVAAPCLEGAWKDGVLLVRAQTKTDSLWAPRGHVVAACSFALQEAPVPRETGGAPHVLETRNAYQISGEGFCYTFRKDEGVLCGIRVNGKTLLNHPMRFNCFRAPTDNDRAFTRVNIYLQWHKTFNFGDIEYPEIAVRNFACVQQEDCVLLGGDFLFGVQGRLPVSTGRITYRVYADGTLQIAQTSSISPRLPYWLPRYGYAFCFDEELTGMEYFGYGPAECYEDKCSHALLGRHVYCPDDPRGAYEKPQESGSHTGTRWLEARIQGETLRFAGNFSFCASRYDVHTTTQAAHRKDMVPSAGTNLYIDYRMSGVGSSSCGGEHPHVSCRINPGEQVDFTLEIQPKR